MNLFTKHCAAALFFTATITFQSCNDHDFDWEEAHSQNAEYNYEQNFKEMFGAISPSQNWDFSNLTGTRVNGEPIFDMDNAITQEELNSRWDTKNWYTVEKSTLDYFLKVLGEGKDNVNAVDQDGEKIGTSFTLEIPNNGFKITPIFQGANDWHPKVYMVVSYNGKSTEYLLWEEGQYLQCIRKNKTSWESAGTGTYGTTDSSYKPLPNIQGNSLVFKNGDFPVGAQIAFKSVSTKNLNGTPAEEPTNVETGMVHPNSSTYYYYSTAAKGSPYILALDKCPRPSNITEKTKVDGVLVDHEVMLISCEGGFNTDMNEVVFLIEGDPYVPRIRKTEGYEVISSKRYMVEDMGYSDKSSLAVTYGYTDIDFNDIVVDFEKTVAYKDKFNGTQLVEREYDYNKIKWNANIRALGGTWDFVLYVDEKNGTTVTRHPIFCKSKSTNTAHNVTINNKTVNLPKVEFNTQYVQFSESASSGAALTATGPLKSYIMYNTNQESGSKGDGHYTTDYNNRQSTICTITDGNVAKWDPDLNNISFEILDTHYGPNFNGLYDSATDPGRTETIDDEEVTIKNVYNITFPAMGATPKIIAFPNVKDTNYPYSIIQSKKWQSERVPVTKGWFFETQKAVDDSGNFIE